MIFNETVLAVIPARSGSMRVPQKNFRPFRGMTLWQWSVNAALRSKYIDVHLLSTDDSRHPLLCTDIAKNEDVLRWHLQQWKDAFEWVVLLQPTSPLRLPADIDACLDMAYLGNTAVISYNEETDKKNGAVYVARAKWLAANDFSSEHHERYNMPASRSLDIDYEADFLK